jgi:hypothetical protein
MPCLPIPELPFPELPGQLSITPPIPTPPDFDPKLCCKLLPFQIKAPPLPIPPLVLNPAALAVLRTAQTAIRTYRDAIPLKCPRE